MAPAHDATLAHFDKQDLVMRNANSDVDIYTSTANTDTRYLSNSQLMAAPTLFTVVKFTPHSYCNEVTLYRKDTIKYFYDQFI